MFTKLKDSMTMIQCIGSLNKDTEIIRKNQMEIVKLKSRITEILKIHRGSQHHIGDNKRKKQ